MEDIHENGYSLKHFTKKFKLPRLVRVVSGIYDMLDEISLSREEILTLHSLKKYETVKASDEEGHTFYLPLNITSKVAVISSELNENSRKSYVDVETLADDFPPLVTSTHAHNWLEIDAGDILKPIQTWITNPREGYLQCEILNKPLNDNIFIPLSYRAKFETLETTHHNSLFLKEVVTNYALPVQVRFLENRVFIQKHDVNAGRPTSLDTLGIITLHGQCDLALVVATTIDPDSGKVHSLLNLPQDLDITIMPYPGSPKRPKKNDNPDSRLLGFCDKNFVYGSTIIEEKQIEDAESHGYEDVLPRLFPRKKPGALSRFKHRHSLERTKLNPHDNDGSNDLGCEGSSSHGDHFHGNGNVVEDVVKMEQHCDGDFVDGTEPTGQNRTTNNAESEQQVDTAENEGLTGITRSNKSRSSKVKSAKETDEPDVSVDTKVSVDVVKELEKFKASLKLHYRPYKFNENSPYAERTSKKDGNCDTSKLTDDGGQDGSHCSDSNTDSNLKSNQTEQKSSCDSAGSSGEPLEVNLNYADVFGALDRINLDVESGEGGRYSSDSCTDSNLRSEQKLKCPAGQKFQSDYDNVGETNVFGPGIEVYDADKNYDNDTDEGTVVTGKGKQGACDQETADGDGNNSRHSRNSDDTCDDSDTDKGTVVTGKGKQGAGNQETADDADGNLSMITCDDNDREKGTVVTGKSKQCAGDWKTAGDDDDNHYRNDSDSSDNNDTDKDASSSGITSMYPSIESHYAALNTSTIASAETRLTTLKRLREQKFSLGDTSEDTDHTTLRPRVDLEGYTIPTRSLIEGSESPRTFMRSRTLTDSFLHCAEDDDGSRSLKTRSIGVDSPDEYKKYLYMNRTPAPSPPQYNTLPASLSKKSKSKSLARVGKGSMTKLTVFARKGISRSQSTADVDKYSYAYVESVNNPSADRATDIGKVFDIRKAFKKKSKYQAPVEEPRGGLQATSRDRLQTLDVDQVCKLLKTLSLDRYVKNFKEAKIDGNLLVDLTDEMMIELQVKKEVDRHKLRKTIEEGWLPKESKGKNYEVYLS